MSNLLIGIAGASGSGKTHISKIISEEFEDSLIINMDNYYVSKPHLTLEDRSRLNFDKPSMIDWRLLIDHITKLKDNKPVNMPNYSFITHLREGKAITLPKKIIIMEGLFAIYNKKLNDIINIKIFLDVDLDTCFQRRCKRDIEERGRTKESAIKQYKESVLPAFYKYVLPTKNNADMITNGDTIKLITKIKQLLKVQPIYVVPSIYGNQFPSL